MPEIQIHVVVSPIFAENAYVAHFEGQEGCVVVDPGLDVESLLGYLHARNLKPDLVLNTHGHADHIAGNSAMKDAYPGIPIVIGEKDADKLIDPVANLSSVFGIELVSPPADQLVREGDVVAAGGVDWHVLETPGHCIGHVVFLCKQTNPWIVLGGDVLFREGIGRTDFPDGDPQSLGHSIREKMFTLPDDTVVYPGHGEPTTIAHEKANNPFLNLLM